MSPEDQRIAIAESVGFKCDWEVLHQNLEHFKGRDGYPDAIFTLAKIPDYLNDINAMHEVEKAIPVRQIAEYTWILASHLDSDWADADVRFAITHATAAQRAEAYLRTIGKWKESSGLGVTLYPVKDIKEPE